MKRGSDKISLSALDYQSSGMQNATMNGGKFYHFYVVLWYLQVDPFEILKVLLQW